MASKIFIVAILVLSAQAFAADGDPEKLRIASPELGEQIQTLNKQGLYPEILSHLLFGTGIPYDFQVLPLKRLIREMKDGRLDCVWTLDGKLLNKLLGEKAVYVESNPVFSSHHIIFMKKGAPKLTALSQLRNKRVALLNGSHMTNRMRELGAIVVLVPDQDTKIRLFLADRVDAILSWTPDILITMKNYDAQSDKLSIVYKIASTPVKIVCRPGENIQEYINRINVAIDKFKGNGTLQLILDRLQTLKISPYN